MLTCFRTCFTVIIAITTLVVSAASIPRPSGKSNGIPIQLSKHSPSLNSDKGVNTDRLKSRAASYTAKLLRGPENYERTGTTHHSALKRSGSPNWRRAGLDLTISHDDVWYCTISIGTPPKLFTVQVDTGSGDLFIPASTGNENCKSHDNLWDPASSETAQDLDKLFQLRFEDGADVGGKQYIDNLTIAGFTADKQTIGVATTYSANLVKSRFPSDGLLGLALPSRSEYPATPLIQTLVNEGKLSDGVFSLKLTSDGGEIYIGGVNKELYTGDITFVDVQQTTGLWQVIVDDIRVNGKSILRNVVSVVDTGANYIYGDPARLLTLHQAHGGKVLEDGWYTFPCNDFPEVTFTFGGKPFTIPAYNLNYGPVEDDSPDCFSGIIAFDNNDVSTHWSLGADFLKCFYTVFNMDHDPPQVGFAHLEGLLEV